MRVVLSLIAALALLVASPGANPNWPQWRGPSADGVSTESGLPVSWGAECGAARKPVEAPAQPQRRGWFGGREGRPIVTHGCADIVTKNVAWRLSLPAYSGSTPI